MPLQKFPLVKIGGWRLVRAGMREFDPFCSSQAVLRLVMLPKKREDGPKIPAFCAFTLVSGLSLCPPRGENRRKSPAVSANIPVLWRLSAETSSITTAARPWHCACVGSPDRLYESDSVAWTATNLSGVRIHSAPPSKSLILREETSHQVFSRDFRGLAAASAQVVH
jgi:hypothetical protein